jgi:hypothetical protein
MYIPLGAHYYDVGYSASGVFELPSNGYGNTQYFCDISFNGERFSDPVLTSGVDNLASDDVKVTAGTVNGCQHTGGSSGGPVFLLMSDGSWVINGVNSSGPSNGQWGLASSWNWFSSVATNLYCYVIGCGQSATRSAAGMAPAVGASGERQGPGAASIAAAGAPARASALIGGAGSD